MARIWAHVINDGGFEYGMDAVTPASWIFGRERSRKVYRKWLLPPYMHAWAKQNPQWIGTYNELQSIASKLRP